MFRLLTISLDTDTITETGQAFSIDHAVGFTVINHGITDCKVSYENGSNAMLISKGMQRSYGGYSGFVYKGRMKIDFINSTTGLVEITKDIVDSNEENG
jgi:hypothetical protein